MAERPTLPRISDISPPVYNQSGVRDRVGRTVTAANLATEFANASGAFREASADAIGTVRNLDGLITSAPLLVDTANASVESPDIVPAFNDGGFHYVDDMLTASRTRGNAQEALASRYDANQ